MADGAKLHLQDLYAMNTVLTRQSSNQDRSLAKSPSESDYESDEQSSDDESEVERPRSPRKSARPKKPAKLTPWKVGGTPSAPVFPDASKIRSWQKIIDLNIERGYGRSRSASRAWGAAAGLRELIQNLFDGILEYKNLQPHELRVEEVPAGKRVDPTAPFVGECEQEFHLFLYDANLAAGSTKQQLQPLGYVAWRPSTSNNGDLELFNVGQMSKSAWAMGHSTKKKDKKFVGQYGDGAKIGINAILRENDATTLVFHTKRELWEFGYFGTHLSLLQRTRRKEVDGVLVQIRNVSWTALDLDRFLFLRPPIQRLPASYDPSSPGWLLLDEKHRTKIYVKNIFIRAEKDPRTGLHYGINIMEDIAMSRDRSAMEDRAAAAKAIYNIWRPLLLSSEDARTRYIDLLMDHEHALDVEEVDEWIDKECADVLFATIRAKYGPDAFFFYAEETTDARRIIEDHLRMTPVLLTQIFFNALRAHETIRTPEDARMKAFARLPPYDAARAGPAFSHTLHTLRALLRADPQTERFRSSWAFKSSHFSKALEICVDGDDVHLSDQLLLAAYVHEKPGWDVCPHAGGRGHGLVVCDCPALLIGGLMADELHGSQSMKQELRLLHRHLAEQMPRGLRVVFQDGEAVLSWEMRISVAVGFIIVVREAHEKDVVEWVYSSDPPQTVKLESNGSTELAELTAGGLVVEAVDMSTTPDDPPPPPRSETDEALVAAADGMIVEQEAEDRQGTIAVVLSDEARPSIKEEDVEAAVWPDCMRLKAKSSPRTLPRLPPGSTHVTQVRVDSDAARIRKSIWSPPFVFTVPPATPAGLSLTRSPPSSALVEWERAEGACTYKLTFMVAGVARKTVLDLEECCWRGEFPWEGPVTVKVLSCARDGTESVESAVLVHTPEELADDRNTDGLSSHGSDMYTEDFRSHARALSGALRSTQLPTIPAAADDAGSDPEAGVESLVQADSGGQSTGSTTPVDDRLPDPEFDSDSDDQMEAQQDGDGPHNARDAAGYPTFWEMAQSWSEAAYMPPEDPRHAAGAVAKTYNSYVFNGMEICVGTAYTVLLASGVYNRVIMRVHDIVDSGPRGSVRLFATRYIWASDFFGPTFLDTHECDELLLVTHKKFRGIVRQGRRIAAESVELSTIHAFEGVVTVLPSDVTVAAAPGAYVCRWAVVSDPEEKTIKIVPLTAGVDLILDGPVQVTDEDALATVVDLYAGCGGASVGFKAAGFKPIAGIESQIDAATSWQLNFPEAPMHAEKAERFLDDLRDEKIASPGPVGVLLMCPSREYFRGHGNTSFDYAELKVVGRAIATLQPSYVVFEATPTLLSPRHRKHFSSVELDMLALGYSLTFALIDAADHGIAATRIRVVLLAAAPGRALPAWPAKINAGQPSTLRDAIQDLEWRNPRQTRFGAMGSVFCTVPSDQSRIAPSAYGAALCAAKANEPLSYHITGRKNVVWSGSVLAAEYDEVFAGLDIVSPRGNIRHPKHTDELLTARELARILSFPDSHLFSGSSEDVCRQIVGAVPPLLAYAIAVQIRQVMTGGPRGGGDDDENAPARAKRSRGDTDDDGIDKTKRFRQAA
ncbi:hypothetical protein BV25DRAFT_1832890 [Artomyces pyxidatus]|uniref:Uncharacterized protein n=1 Tax=Artomyces pyxidatus TaxID=48021 RepID=A0ACB8SHP7_9AGAM|nr:hypothetical protein BV25DRAFT_1832890 [Artomyces pyxidatus]